LALGRLQSVCGKIGLNISVGKTEWLYLHNPAQAELLGCAARRTPLVRCCEEIKLNGVPLRHVSTFKYLGCLVSEDGGVEEETRFRILQAQLSLNRYNGIWKSTLTLRQKIRFLKTHVLPILVYGAECGNHTQRDLSKYSVFLNMCRRRLLQVGRRTAEGRVISNEELQRKCRLMQPMDLLSRRRVVFVAKLVHRPSCEMARKILFAEVATQCGVVPKKVSGRQRSSFQNVLDLDLRYLYSGAPVVKSLDDILTVASCKGMPYVKHMLKALKPDFSRGASLNLVAARVRDLVCPAMGCQARFAERKEVNRHVRNNHPEDAGRYIIGGRGTVPGPNAPSWNPNTTGENGARVPASGVISARSDRTANSRSSSPQGNTEGNSLACPVAGCSKVYKAPGWLARHLKSNHSGVAVPENPNTPPTVQVAVVGPAIAGESGELLVVGTGSAVNPPPESGRGPVVGNPVPLVGDNQCGQQGYCLRRRPRDHRGGHY
jgi:hypothetical protein